ncbi:MAG: hypothetical protein HQL69_12405 [Magnetococcales bacterium]|nr:hypothetical protein [Magnetococcales bacterium]
MKKSNRKKSKKPQSTSLKERRFNQYDLSPHKNHEVGIIIGEEGYKVCDEKVNLCPIAGVPTLAEAEKLQSLMSGERTDRRAC